MVEFPYAFRFNGERLFIHKTHYYDGERIALQIVDVEEQPFAMLTVNIPEIRLREGEFLVKTWSENEDIAQCVLDLGIFEDTGKRFKTGFVVGEIWELKQEY